MARTASKSVYLPLIVPTSTAPVSCSVTSPAAAAASMASTDVSSCPFTVVAKGRSPTPLERAQGRYAGTTFEARSTAQHEDAAQVHTVRTVVLLWRAGDGVVVHEGRILALRRVVLRPYHVKVAQSVARHLALKLHVRERHPDLDTVHPHQLVATDPIDVTAGQLSAISWARGVSGRGAREDKRQRGGHCGHEDAGRTQETSHLPPSAVCWTLASWDSAGCLRTSAWQVLGCR